MEPARIARRIEVLERTVSRRHRLDEALRAELAARRGEHAQAQQEAQTKADQVQSERVLLQSYYDRIARMMSGGSVVSVTEMTGCMRYAEVVAQRLHVLEAELSSLEQVVDTTAEQVAAAARAVANNRGRIDLCKNRIGALGRDLDTHANDASDEEAEDAALRARTPHALKTWYGPRP